MQIGVCVKRVPMVGGKIVLTPDGQDVDTRMSGFTVSPHEECAVEEAVQITERQGGTVTVLTLGPPEAADQLRADGREWGPIATAAAITDAVLQRASGPDGPYDLLLFGNEAADTGDYQVPVRVAHALGLPCVTGIKNLEITESGAVAGAEAGAGAGAGFRARARREYRGSEEIFDLALPAVISVKEGINLPRYPSLPGRLRAKRAVIERFRPEFRDEALRKELLRVPAGETKRAEILGSGADAVPALVRLFEELGVLS